VRPSTSTPRDLELQAVTDEQGQPVEYELGARDPVLGTRLRLTVPATVSQLEIRYATTPASSALQWLTAQQTADGRHPYVFSQCQTIHARSMLPVPDSPAHRFNLYGRDRRAGRLHRADGRGRGRHR